MIDNMGIRSNPLPNKHEMSGKVVIITGGAQGIGYVMARAFARVGAMVVIADIEQKKGVQAAAEIEVGGCRADYYEVDLRLPGAPVDMVYSIAKKYGQVDVLINNARSRIRTSLTEESEATWDEAMSVNLKAPFFASQAAISVMAKQSKGCIINISSVGGLLACHESPAYHASKAGLVQLTRYLATRVGGNGVRINAIAPGWIVKQEHSDRYLAPDNKAFRELSEFCHPIGRTGTSEDVADTALFLSSDASRFITGQTLVVDGGLTIQEPSDLAMRVWRENDTKISG